MYMRGNQMHQKSIIYDQLTQNTTKMNKEGILESKYDQNNDQNINPNQMPLQTIMKPLRQIPKIIEGDYGSISQSYIFQGTTMRKKDPLFDNIKLVERKSQIKQFCKKNVDKKTQEEKKHLRYEGYCEQKYPEQYSKQHYLSNYYNSNHQDQCNYHHKKPNYYYDQSNYHHDYYQGRQQKSQQQQYQKQQYQQNPYQSYHSYY